MLQVDTRGLSDVSGLDLHTTLSTKTNKEKMNNIHAVACKGFCALRKDIMVLVHDRVYLWSKPPFFSTKTQIFENVFASEGRVEPSFD